MGKYLYRYLRLISFEIIIIIIIIIIYLFVYFIFFFVLFSGFLMLDCLQLLYRQGYILYVNGKWSGEILEPGQKQTTLTGFTPGNAICVQLSAITYDLPAPVPIHSNQGGAKLQHFSSRCEQPDSGIESSSSLRSKRPAEETKRYACSTGPPLVIQYSNLVKSVSSLELVKLGCRSASVTWSLDNSADCSIEPKVLTILCWKLSAEECVIKQIVTGKMVIDLVYMRDSGLVNGATLSSVSIVKILKIW